MDKLVVVLGSCSVDFTTYAERLPAPGETLHGYKFSTSNGGKGANQCMAAAKLGSKTAMIAKVGGDIWGAKYIQHFKESRIDTTFMSAVPDQCTGVAQINVSRSGENQIVIVPGANNSLTVKEVENAKEVIQKASVLVCQLETPMESTERAFELCKGVKILNAAPALPKISQKLLSLTTVLCVNESEASILTGKTVDSPSEISAAIEILLGYGCETVIITLGANGAVFATQSDKVPVHVLCEKVVPVDTTGAGDAFLGALATLMATQEESLSKIIGASCQVATMSVTKEGTQESYPTIEAACLMQRDYKNEKLL